MREYLRKSIHLVFGLAIAALLATLDRQSLLIGLSLAVLVGFILSEVAAKGYRMFFITPMLDLVDRREALPGKGALFFVLSTLIVLILFSSRVAFLSILALSIVDGVATIAGRAWGRTRIVRGKTIEGSLSGTAVAILVFVFFIPPSHAVGLALISAAVELVSPIDDNLVIPITAGLFLRVLGY